MTEGSRQVFSALELGPGCLVLGIGGGPPRVWKVPMSLLRNVEEPMAFPVSVGTNGASRCGDTHWTALEKVQCRPPHGVVAVITRGKAADCVVIL